MGRKRKGHMTNISYTLLLHDHDVDMAMSSSRFLVLAVGAP